MHHVMITPTVLTLLSLQLRQLALKVIFVLLMVLIITKAGWKCVTMESGELCVMIAGVEVMEELLVVNWD